MGNGALTQTPNNSGQHPRIKRIGPLQVKSATDIMTAKAFNAIFVGVPIAATVPLVNGVTGRNVRITVVDANNSETWAFLVSGVNQFNELITERIPASGTTVGAGVGVGTKIFARVDTVTPVSLAGDLAVADTVSLGTGDKVGLDFIASTDLHEILDMELQLANQATGAGKKTVNATNIDVVNAALDFTAFGAGNVVVAGDSVQLRVRTDCLTPDDLNSYPTGRSA